MSKDIFGLPGDLEALANKQIIAEEMEFVFTEIGIEVGALPADYKLERGIVL